MGVVHTGNQKSLQPKLQSNLTEDLLKSFSNLCSKGRISSENKALLCNRNSK